MKHFFLTLIVFFITFNSGYSQIKWGVKAGINRTNIKIIHSPSFSRHGFQVGAIAQISMDNRDQIYIQPELTYFQHGETSEEIMPLPSPYDDVTYKSKYFIDYITLPILLKAYLSDTESAFYVEGGPQFAYAISQKTSSEAPDGIALYQRLDDGNEDKVNNFDVTFGLGLGYSINRTFEFGLRYNYGFVDIYPNGESYESSGRNNSSAFSFSVFYIFQ